MVVVARASMQSAVLLALGTISLGMMASAGAARANEEANRRKAEEQEMLAKARAEQSGARQRLEGASTGRNLPDREVHVGRAPVGADQNAQAQQREAELQRLSDKLRRAHAGRAKPTPPVETPWKTEVTHASPATGTPLQPESRSALGHRLAAATLATDTRATILLVMTPGSKGIRRFEKTADPILCSNEGCYISNGIDTAARYISLRRSFGMLNTFGPRAGACRQSTTCVFRGVDVSASNAILQPVDLKLMVHDRRAIKAALVDETCSVDAGRLSCSRPLKGDDFVMWVVPESIAQRAGSAALRFAVDQGLTETQRAARR